MKPVQIGLLVLVGAMGGALIMKFSQRQAPGIVPAPIVTPAPFAAPPPEAAPAAVVAQPSAVAPQPVPAPPPATEPAPSPKKAAATRVHHARPAREAVTTVAENLPPDPEPSVPEPSVPEPVREAPAAAAEPTLPATPPAAPEQAEPPAPDPPLAPTVTLQAGTLLPVRLGESLSSEHNQSGDTFTATLDAPLVVDGFVIAERGARVEGRVVEVQKASHVKGQAALALELTKLNTSDGQHVGIQTDAFRKQAPKSTEQDVGIVAAAAGVGAVIGAIAGGGKGAGIGAAAGGAAGTGGVMATRAKAVELPSETKVSFRLRQTVTLTEQVNR
jgi:hypothetical protein